MASVNKRKISTEQTHGGSPAVAITPVQQLRRSVMSCMLWENEFYEDGITIAQRIAELVAKCDKIEVANIAIEAKTQMRLRHTPLFLARELCRTKEGRAELGRVIPQVVNRVDDITELLSIYLMDKKTHRAPAKLPNQLKKHLGATFKKFDEYQLAKYNGGKKSVSLKDAMRMLHPVKDTEEQSALWSRLLKDELQTPDTWEVEISASKDKKASWERLLTENKLGGLAMLRNIRNMKDAKVSDKLIKEGILSIKAGRLLPINFISAARHNPGFEPELESKFLECLADKPKLPGKTILVVDTSGSMQAKLSNKSELTRKDVATGLAMIAREMCEEVVIYATAGNDGSRKHATMQIPARRGFALADYINGNEVARKIGGGGIFIVQCMDYIYSEQNSADRIIVITDEQDCDQTKNPLAANTFGKENYLINIASAKNGIGYRKWTHVDGWSDKVLDFIVEFESVVN
jgi:60 kDa SS-A/Ro ribonucleoprotein